MNCLILPGFPDECRSYHSDPTQNHGPTLRASIASALRQTSPVEIFVIGDGVPDETRQILHEITNFDMRVLFFDHPKGPCHGEIYRHRALLQERGRIVCYLADDDLYLPHHAEEMSGSNRINGNVGRDTVQRGPGVLPDTGWLH